MYNVLMAMINQINVYFISLIYVCLTENSV